eukprot:m.344093 g.344093  ORF g.344093 m.344093 type:complete len:408 (-) comp23829_c0_seq1:43-1266(-)
MLLITVRALFFLQCCAACCVCNFLVLFYRHKGLSFHEIGIILGGIYPLGTIVGQVTGTSLADATGKAKFIALFSVLSQAGAIYSLQYIHGFLHLALLTGASAVLGGPVNPILDASAIHTITHTYGLPLADYGKFRVYGALGWGIAAAIVGYMLDLWGLKVLFYSFAGVTGVYLLVMCTFPMKTDKESEDDDDETASLIINTERKTGEEQVEEGKVSLCSHLFMKTDAALFFPILIVMGACKACVDLFLFLYLQEELGASNLLLGLTLSMTTVSELPFFFFSGYLLKKAGALPVCLVALFAYALRLGYYSILRRPWLVLPIELLHGLTFALSWTAVASHASEIAPPGYKSLTQGIAGALFWGVGFACGGIGGGFLNEAYGPVFMYEMGALLALGSCVLGTFLYAVFCR